MLRLTDLHKRFGERTAVDGISLEVRRGEVLGLLGPNGAGKSTTIHMAVGLLEPDRGTVDVGGLGSPRRPEVRRSLGVAPQSIALYEPLTPEENLRFFGRAQGLSGRALSARVEWALDFATLVDRRKDRTADLSGGMKRRLNMAAALVHDPALILLDEPTVGVDPQSRNAILDRVIDLRRADRAVVYTTHYMEEAARICDRIAIVDAGRVLALGTLPELLARHGGDPVLVVVEDGAERRITTPDPARELGAILASRRVDDFRVERAGLETVFLGLTGRRLRDE